MVYLQLVRPSVQIFALQVPCLLRPPERYILHDRQLRLSTERRIGYMLSTPKKNSSFPALMLLGDIQCGVGVV